MLSAQGSAGLDLLDQRARRQRPSFAPLIQCTDCNRRQGEARCVPAEQGRDAPPDSRPSSNTALTLEGWSETFLDDTRALCEPKTFANYRLALGHLLPLVGKVQLLKLTREDVDAALEGVRRGVSSSMAGRCRRVLHTVLEQAIAKGFIGENAAKPKKERQGRAARAARGLTSKTVYAPTAEECDRIFTAAKGNRLEALLIVAVTCGLRWAELAGLRWSDIDLAKRTLTVAQTLPRVRDRRGRP